MKYVPVCINVSRLAQTATVLKLKNCFAFCSHSSENMNDFIHIFILTLHNISYFIISDLFSRFLKYYFLINSFFISFSCTKYILQYFTNRLDESKKILPSMPRFTAYLNIFIVREVRTKFNFFL